MRCTICDDEYEQDEGDQGTEGDLDEGGNHSLIGVVATTMCHDCARMIGRAAKKREEAKGSGPITTVDDEGTIIHLNQYEQLDFLISLSLGPEEEYHIEGKEFRFNDHDLLRWSKWRMRKKLTQKGFTDIPDEMVEDYSMDVVVDFLEGIRSNKDIKTIHGWHWSLISARFSKMAQEWVELRQAHIPEDIIDYATKHQITDPYNWGAASSIDEHRRKLPLWVNVTIDNLGTLFESKGVSLTNAELKTLRYIASGEGDGKNRTTNTNRKLRSINRKIKDADPDLWDVLEAKLAVEDE